MTSGMFFRIEREGTYYNVLLEDLTECELSDVLSNFLHGSLLDTINILCRTYGRRDET